MRMKVGILFGGPSREREISFAGGRAVYDNLDKSLFTALPIFVDSHRNFILLDWQNIYKGSIRDFYPPGGEMPASNPFHTYVESLGELTEEKQEELIGKIGRRIQPAELAGLIDIAFLALHGLYGEDGQIQQQLTELGIPFTGSGARASRIGLNKALQKELMSSRGFRVPEFHALSRTAWLESRPNDIYQEAINRLGFPMLARPAKQGASVGYTTVEEDDGLEGFDLATNRAFFREILPVYEWNDRDEYERQEYVRLLTDIREGLGFPMDVRLLEGEQTLIYHPQQLLEYLNLRAATADDGAAFILESHQREEQVLLESYVEGRAFSCVVLRKEDKSIVALPPTEILEEKETFGIRSKYLPGLSRHITPIGLPEEQISAIRRECERLFSELGFQAYARIDGMVSTAGDVFLTDASTASAMLPSSFLFRQAAEIGLNPTQFLTYLIYISLQERLWEDPEAQKAGELIQRLNHRLAEEKARGSEKKRIAVLLGGYSYERHISVESGRNVFEKLASSDKYRPIPIFLSGKDEQYVLHQMPLNLLLRNNADDIREAITTFRPHPALEAIRRECRDITRKYASGETVFEPRPLRLNQLPDTADAVFIALHGRPGEDGPLQQELERLKLPYNGSGPQSSAITINKYQTLQTLKRNGFSVPEQVLLHKNDYEKGGENFFRRVESRLDYPLVAKPVDDGCSSAVRVIRSRAELEAYTRLLFRPAGEEGLEARRALRLKTREEFPRKEVILFESRITGQGAKQFMEITAGLLTHFQKGGSLRYEIFEPSEALPQEEVLSLEEKFLSGEERHLTPARFGKGQKEYQQIAGQVKARLEQAARILNIQGYARLDAFTRIYEDNSVETILIKANSLPGLTPVNCIFQEAALNGYQPYGLISHIIDFGFERQALAEQPKETEEKTEEPPVDPVRAPKASPAGPASGISEEEAIVYDPTFSGEEKKEQKPSGGFRPQPFWKYLLERLRYAGREVVKFLASPVFLRNFAALLAVLLVFFFLLTRILKLYTHHGESIQVPNYVGMDLEDATRKARKQDFKIVVIDSFFDSGKQPNTIYQQDPKPLQRAKEGRTIYVSKYRVLPDSVILPTLLSAGYNYNQYAIKLKRMDIESNIRERVFDRKQEENSIVHFYYKGKKITDEMLRRGVRVPKGATLDFVITERITGTVSIPELVCKRYDAATFLISSSNLALGEVYGEVSDEAYVYKQEPEYVPGQQLGVGQTINLYLSSTRPTGCPEEIDPSSLDIGGGEEENEDFN